MSQSTAKIAPKTPSSPGAAADGKKKGNDDSPGSKKR
jgi:hypothetical protein